MNLKSVYWWYELILKGEGLGRILPRENDKETPSEASYS